MNKITQNHTTKNWSRRILKEGRPKPSLSLPPSFSSSYFSIYIYFLALITLLHTYVFSLSLSPHYNVTSQGRGPCLLCPLAYPMHPTTVPGMQRVLSNAPPEWLPHRLHQGCVPHLWGSWTNWLTNLYDKHGKLPPSGHTQSVAWFFTAYTLRIVSAFSMHCKRTRERGRGWWSKIEE